MTQEGAGKGLRGKWVLLIMAVMAASLAGGLYWIAVSDTPAEYRASKPGAPASPVRVATVDLQWEPDIRATAERLRGARPDIVLVQHATGDSLVELAKALAMHRPGQVFYSELGIDGRTQGGCGIIARHQLYRHRELRDGTRDAFAVAAEVVVGGRRFLLVSAAIGGADMGEQTEVLRKTTGLLRVGPLVCAGQFGPTPPQGLRRLAADSDGGRVYCSEHWRLRGSGGSGKIAWVEVAAAEREGERR